MSREDQLFEEYVQREGLQFGEDALAILRQGWDAARQSNPDNGLSPAEEERLTLLIEECSEIIKVACKIKRFGYDSINPYAPQDGTNLNQLQLEMGDLSSIYALMVVNGDTDVQAITERSIAKYEKLSKYLRCEHNY